MMVYLAWLSKTLQCGVGNLELREGVPDEMAAELEGEQTASDLCG